jgi:integrase
MPNEARGELRKLQDGSYGACITISGRTRRTFPLVACRGEVAARARCTELAVLAARMRRVGHVEQIPKLLELAASAAPGRRWTAILSAVDDLCSGKTEAVSATPTVSAFGEEWRSGALHRRFPDHVASKDSAMDGRIAAKYVDPLVGHIPLDTFALEHADEVMSSLPERRPGIPLSSATRRQVAQYVRRLLTLAVYPARHIKENPIPKGWLPKVKLTKAFTYLHPAEDTRLLACMACDEEGEPRVPVIRRLFYGILAREGLRRGELAALRFRDLDLERGSIRLDVNKTDDPRSWALDPAVARALAAWKVRYRPEAGPDDIVFADEAGSPLYVLHLADALQADLKAAEVKRPELFERSDVRRPIRVHDLRATFVTLSLANGRTEAWVADRTGHRSSVMINR